MLTDAPLIETVDTELLADTLAEYMASLETEREPERILPIISAIALTIFEHLPPTYKIIYQNSWVILKAQVGEDNLLRGMREQNRVKTQVRSADGLDLTIVSITGGTKVLSQVLKSSKRILNSPAIRLEEIHNLTENQSN